MGCIHVIQSPSPYLIGMDSRFFDFFRLPTNSGIAYLDLDTNNFKPPMAPGQPTFDSKVLPKKPLKQLKTRLLELKEKIFQMKNTRQLSCKKISRNMMLDCMFSTSNSELAQDELIKVRKRWLQELNEMTQIGSCIKEAFLQFMVHLLKDYRQCLIPVRNTRTNAMFNIEHFLRECADKHTIPFYRALFETQQWTNFVRDRVYASSRDEELDYFDNRIELLLEESESKSLKSSHSHPHHHRSRNHISFITMSNLFTIKRSASSSHEQLNSTTNTHHHHHPHHQNNTPSNNSNHDIHLNSTDYTNSNHHHQYSDNKSLSSNASIRDKSDESTDSLYSSDLGPVPLQSNNNNQCLKIIDPPCWPVPEFVDIPQYHQLSWIREYSLGFIPTNINSATLDLLAARALVLKNTTPLSNHSITASIFHVNTDSAALIPAPEVELGVKQNNVATACMPLNSTSCTVADPISTPSSHSCCKPVNINSPEDNSNSRLTTGLSTLMMKNLQLNTTTTTTTNTTTTTMNTPNMIQRFGSFMFIDSSSPLLIRSNRSENTSLIGLTTKYNLPVNNSTILKRTSQELRYTLNYSINLPQTDDYSRAKYLAACAYSIWFMLLPGYLSSVHHFYTDEIITDYNHDVQTSLPQQQQQQTVNTVACKLVHPSNMHNNDDHSNDDRPNHNAAADDDDHDDDEVMNIIRHILIQSIHVYKTMHNYYKLEIPDQVALRILLVLLYQNRIENFDLMQFINSMDWTSSSSGIANHIYKAYEKELMEHERLEKERLKSTANNHHSHRRSASADTELNPSSDFNSSENTTNIIAPQPLHSSDDLTDLGYSTLNIHETNKTTPEQDWSPIVEDQSKVITAAATTTTITTTATNNNNNNNNHSMPCATSTEDHQQGVKHGQQSSSVVVVIGNDHDHSDAKCHAHHRDDHDDDTGQSKEHPTNPTTPNINNNNVDDITNVRENTSSQLVNHIVNISGTTAGVGTETPMAANIHNDAVNSNHIDNSSGSRLSDDSCTEDDDDDDEEEEEDGESEHEHPHYGYKLLSSALSKIKRPFLQHYNTPTTTTTTTHTPLSYHTTLYSHHSSIDMTQGSKHALFSKLSRQSFDENSSTMNVMRQSIHHQNFTNHTTTTTTTTNNDNSNHNYSHDYDGDADDVEDKDNEDTNAQAKVSVVYNAFNLFNRSTSDFINRINMNRSLLDWRSLIPSLSTNPTPQSGRRATTTSNCFTGSNFPDQQYLQPEQHQHQHNQQYYSFSPQYHYQQPQSERISRVSWSKQSSSGTGMKTTDSIDHQLNTVNNHSYNVAPKLSDSACVAVHPTLYGTNHDYYYSHENYPINNQNINDYHQLINQFPYDNNYDHENYALDNHHIDQAHQFKDMWIHIAGSLLVGDINRRISPGNTRTIYLQQCLYQQHMYNNNNNNSSTSLSAIPTTSFSINRSESSHVISTSNTTLESAIVDGKSTTSIPIMVTATTTTTTANSNLNQQQLTSMSNDQQTSSVVSDSSSTVATSTVQSPLILGQNNSNNNNNKESSPSFSTTSTTATTTTTSNDSQFSNINHHYCITHLNIFITTCSICSKCKHYVYDEEIMAGWSTDENDHRTICPFCKTYFIPQLSIRIFGDTSGGGGGGGVASHGYNQSVKLSQNQSTMKHFHTPSISQSLNNLSNVQCDRNDSTESIPVKSYNSGSPGQSTSVGLMEMTFSYLSPFVIRKTLETIIQNEGDECLRCRSIPHSLLNRSGQLTWNLVWLMHRLGLPTHLLDSLPLWMINYQAEQRRKVKFDQANSTTTSHTHHRHHHHHFGSPHGQNNNNIHINNNNNHSNNNNNSTIFTDALYQVRLSPNLPVYISLRWNATHPVRSVMRNSLYKYCFNSKYSDHNTPWSLVNLANAQDTFGQQFISNPAHNNNNLHLLNKQTPVNALIHCCPIHAIIDYLIIAIKKDDMRWAVDFLIQIRGHLQLNSSLPLIIKQLCTTFSSATPTSSSPTSSSPSLNTTSITSSTTATVPPTSTTQSTFEMKNGKLIRRNRNQQPQCASLQCYAACSENSLYRELLFLIVHALSRTSLDLMSFDEQYKLVYQSFRNSGCTLLTDFDQPPTLMASICRQMLRPLTLRP
ncbi:unnamed protein product [Schistosoma turkestanicum]|nr:unnamed protein product [Schistosoma turkestanicum]